MVRRKQFKKTDLSIPVLQYASPDEIIKVPPEALQVENTIVKFPAGSRYRTFAFTGWYGVGIDIITYACQKQIERFLANQDKEVETTTIIAYCKTGLRHFLDYLCTLSLALNRDLALDDINRDVIDGYIGFIKSNSDSAISQKNQYTATKPVLKELCRRGFIKEVIGGDEATFPRNPFPGSHKGNKGEKPLTKVERASVAIALKTAVMPIFDSSIEPTCDVLAYAYLIIALHTGANTTPLLEMTPDCLRPHPKSGMSFLTLFKRRGHSTRGIVVQDGSTDGRVVDSLPAVRPTVAKLVRRVIELSASLRDKSPAHFRNRVWLYRVRTTTHLVRAGEISALTPCTLAIAIRRLVNIYNLVNSDGKPLRLNVGRLRKTFINRIYEILDGDVAATATASGSSIAVTDINYLRPGEDAKKNWRFLGIVLTHELTTDTLGSTKRTPIGGCTDVKDGQYAPKNGKEVCMNFLNCVRCKNYVVTADDLYRLFSFYWRIYEERARMDVRQWRKSLSHIVRVIDRDIINFGISKKLFSIKAVNEAKSLAKANPHPFWKHDLVIQNINQISAQ